jgi:hypothetical protein
MDQVLAVRGREQAEEPVWEEEAGAEAEWVAADPEPDRRENVYAQIAGTPVRIRRDNPVTASFARSVVPK